MDFVLRCNSLKCRRQVNDRAVVTTCSHIFCLDCSNNLGLSNADLAMRVCPACEAALSNPDDAVETCLDPSEDYKTSVLSGLSPSIIMECAGSGLAFYSYQTTQEIVYQEYLAKSLTDKYSNLNAQVDKIVHEANAEIASLREKLQAVQVDQKKLENENHKLAEAFREKSASHAKTNKMYQTLKAQVLVGQVATAASDDAEATLQSVHGERFIDGLGGRTSRQQNYPAMHTGTRLQSGDRGSVSSGNAIDAYRTRLQGHSQHGQMQNARLFGQDSNIQPTPSQHRTRLGHTGLHQIGTPLRQPLGNLGTNSVPGPGLGGYGLSSGVRAGKQMNSSLGRTAAWSNFGGLQKR